MPSQVIRRVVGRAYDLDVELADEGLAAELLRGQFGIALLKDITRCFRLKDRIDAEHAAEFQMRPMVQRVAIGMGNGVRPFLELLPRAAIASYVVLRHAVGTHCAPFVMVTAQPQLGHVAELYVLRDLPGIQVAVIVYDGQPLGTSVVKLTGMTAREHEIFMDETHGRF